MTHTPAELVAAAVRSVVLAELGGADGVPSLVVPEVAAAGADYLEAVNRHRVAALLAPHSDQLGLSAGIKEALVSRARQETLDAMVNASDTIRVSAALADAAVPHLMLKGVVLAQQTTGSAGSRGAGDVDLLVEPGSVRTAVAVLEGAGWRLNRDICPPLDSPLFSPTLRSQKELMLVGDGSDVDLHWRLDDSRACLSWDLGELVNAAEWIDMGGVQLPTLSRAHAAVFNASHGARDSWSQLRSLVDQVRLQQGQSTDALRAEAWRVGAGRRWDLAQAMIAKLMVERPPAESRSTRPMADAVWAWIVAGEEPRERRDAKASARAVAVGLLTLDSPRAAAQRAGTVLWPVRNMAARSLGDAGDRHPWLYLASTPYFLPERQLARWSAGSDDLD